MPISTAHMITWTPAERGSGYNGKAGEITLFTLHWLGGDKPWVLRTVLPGLSYRWRGPDTESLQAKAEGLLRQWLDAIGAQVKEAGR